MAALKRVAGWLRGEKVELITDGPPPNPILRPSVVNLFGFATDMHKYDALAIDIENAGRFITVIGTTQLSMMSGKIGRSLSFVWMLHSKRISDWEASNGWSW